MPDSNEKLLYCLKAAPHPATQRVQTRLADAFKGIEAAFAVMLDDAEELSRAYAKLRDYAAEQSARLAQFEQFSVQLERLTLEVQLEQVICEAARTIEGLDDRAERWKARALRAEELTRELFALATDLGLCVAGTS